MHHIRPWKLFERLEELNKDVLYRIPSHRGVESETISSLETLLLIAAARTVSAKRILELGTGLGYNAYNLARNTIACIATIDNVRKPWVFEGSQYERQIFPLTMNLADVEPGPEDMVFCDINYTRETLSKATEIAFACDPKIIAWHDYAWHDYGLLHVKLFHDELSRTRDLYHVEDSSLVFWFKDISF